MIIHLFLFYRTFFYKWRFSIYIDIFMRNKNGKTNIFYEWLILRLIEMNIFIVHKSIECTKSNLSQCLEKKFLFMHVPELS